MAQLDDLELAVYSIKVYALFTFAPTLGIAKMPTPFVIPIKKILAAFILFSVSLNGLADAFVGQISGADCAEHGHLCPLEKFEQHISGEKHFVLLTGNKQFFNLSGISRDILLRYVSKRVIVIGELDKQTNQVNVSELQVQQGEGLGHYESVWQQ